MRLFFSLLKLQLLQQFRPRRGQRFGSAAMLLLPLAFIPMCALLLRFFEAVTEVGATLGAPGIGIELGILIAMLAALMLGLAYIVSSFYYSEDLQLLIPLPIRPDAVLYSKFVLLILNELVSMAIVYIPAVVAYGLVMHGTLAFWLLAAVVWIVLPVIPLAIAALIAMAMMAVTNGRVNRDALRVAFTVFFMVVWIGFQSLQRFWVGTDFASGLNQQGVSALQGLVKSGGLLDLLGRYFPPSVWATRAIMGELPALALLLGISVALSYALAIAARRLFYRGLIGGDERVRHGARMTDQRMQSAIGRTGSPVMAVFRRELRQFNRTPVFLTQALMPLLMAPVYIVLPLMSHGGIAVLRRSVGGVNPAMVLAAIGMMQFLLTAVPIAPSAFSREGARFWMSRALPLSGRDQVRGKLLHAMTLAVIYIALFAVIAGVVFRPSLLQVIAFVALNLVASVVSASIGLRVDLASPRLDWVEPQQAFKSNYNVLYTMLLHALIVLPVGLLVGLMLPFGQPLAYLCGAAALAAAAWLAYREALRFADVRYNQIDL